MAFLLLLTLNGVFADIASIREKTIQPNLLCLIEDEETDILYFPARIALLDKVRVNFGFHTEEISSIEDKVLVSGFYWPNLYKKLGIGFDGYYAKNKKGWGMYWDAFNGSGSNAYSESDFLTGGKLNIIYKFNMNFAGFVGLSIIKDSLSSQGDEREYWRIGNPDYTTSSTDYGDFSGEFEDRHQFITGATGKLGRIGLDFTISVLNGKRANNNFWYSQSIQKVWVQSDTISTFYGFDSSELSHNKNFWGTEGFLRVSYPLKKNRWLRLFGGGYLDLGNYKRNDKSWYQEKYWSRDSSYLKEYYEVDSDTVFSYQGYLKIGLGLEERPNDKLLFGLGAMYYAGPEHWDLSFGVGLEYKFCSWAKIRYGLAPIYSHDLVTQVYRSNFGWDEVVKFLESFDFSHRIGIGLSLSDWCRVDLLCSANFAELKNIETGLIFLF